MNIILYQTTSPNNKINKVLANATTLTGELRNETNLVNPEVRVEGMAYKDYNYAYIEAFGRYYFITEYKSLGHNQLVLYMKVDPLMSFQADILATEILLERTSMSTNAEMDLNTENLLSTEGLSQTVMEYTGAEADFQNGTVLLLTVGAYTTGGGGGTGFDSGSGESGSGDSGSSGSGPSGHSGTSHSSEPNP